MNKRGLERGCGVGKMGAGGAAAEVEERVHAGPLWFWPP